MAADRPLRILAIDGGGIRGIIPAVVLAEIERLAKRPVAALFDLIAGTSTGALLALGLTVGSQRPDWSAQDLVDLYMNEGPEIFTRRLRSSKIVRALPGPHDEAPLE